MTGTKTSGGLYVIDVMPVLYRGHFVFLRNPRMTSQGVNTSAIGLFVNTIAQILSSRRPSHIALAFDSLTPTFRHEAYPAYKAQREKMPEDIAASIPMVAEFAKAMNIPSVRVDGFEADDVIGTLSAMAEKEGVTSYLVSPDKDIAQLVGDKSRLYRLGKGDDDVMDLNAVCEHWGISSPSQIVDLLALEGDSSDNIPGVKGVGEKTALLLISKYGSIEGVIANAADIPGKVGERIRAGVEDMRMSYMLATIRRDIPVGLSVDDLAVAPPDVAAVHEFCAKYELAKAEKRIFENLAELKGESDAMPLFGASSQIPPSLFDVDLPQSDAPKFKRLADVPHEYACVTDVAALDALVAELKAADKWSFDTETTGIDPRKCRLVGISFCTRPGRAWYVNFPDDADLFAAGMTRGDVVSRLAPVFADPSKTRIAHNGKYDCTVLAKHGMPVVGTVRDTMLTHFVIDAAERHGMDALAREYLGYDPIPISSLIGEGHGANPEIMGALAPEKIADYSAEDADVTFQLYEKLRPMAESMGLAEVLETSEEPLARVLSDMEEEGVRIDTAALHTFGDELDTQIERLKADIMAAAGEVFNLDSPKQLGAILFDKLKIADKVKLTSRGQYSTSEAVLQKFAGEHPIVDKVLEYRTLTKLKSTYADKLPECIDKSTGRVHTHFSQSFTETGRLSSSDPNLQNIPVRTELGKRIRAAFVARDDGHVLMSADYSQIELRVMAALSGDESLKDAFAHGADIHSETASRVFGVPVADVTPEMRSKCKMVNFGIIYGISAFGLGQRLSIPRHEAADLIESYFASYPGVRKFMDDAIANAREKGYAETVLGRRRSLRDISSRNATVRQAAERNAINTPVQGSAADLIKLAMVRVHKALADGGFKAKLVLQIHDELLLDVPRDEVGPVTELVREAMVGAYDFGVPLEVEIGCGRTWLEAH